MRALLGTASHFCEVVVLKLRTVMGVSPADRGGRGLAPWEFEFPFPGSLKFTFLVVWVSPADRAGWGFFGAFPEVHVDQQHLRVAVCGSL